MSPQGSGAFGNVHLAVVQDLLPNEQTSLVAVKTLNPDCTQLDKEDFLAEIQVMQKFQPHPNVVSLLGVCTKTEPMYLLVRLAEGGSSEG